MLAQFLSLGILEDDPRICLTLARLRDMPNTINRRQLGLALTGSRLRPNPHLKFVRKCMAN